MTGLDKGGKVQQYIDTFILYHSEPYEPGNHIHKSGVNATKIGSGIIEWNSPDVNYLYEGKLMVDPITLKGAFFSSDYGYWSRPNTEKILDPSGKNLIYHSGGLRGEKWAERMLEKEFDDLVSGVQNIVRGGK